MAPLTRPNTISAALAKDRLGVFSVIYFALSGVAPLTVVAGVVTTAYAVTGLTSVPAAFYLVAAVLALFSIGYIAMSRHVRNAGAFYAYIARGLGRPAGVGAAAIAVVSYNLLQVGLYGAFGVTAAGFINPHLGVHWYWWEWALAAWAVVVTIGVLRVDLNGRVLSVLGTLELIVIVIFTTTGLGHPAGGSFDFTTLAPRSMFTGGAGAALAIAVLGYVGFETSAVYTEEARDPKRTVRIATYGTLGLIAVVYTAASWMLATHYGVNNVAKVAQQQGPGMLFGLGSTTLANIGQSLFLTSLFAAMIAFHSAVGRYLFPLGREQVLPAGLGRPSSSGAPRAASLLQSFIGLAVIVTYAVAGWNPLVQLFFYLGTTGGFGILVLAAVTSISVLVFFARDRRGESAWVAVIAPCAAAALLIAMVWLAVANYNILLGVAPSSDLAWMFPAVYAVAAVLGVAWAAVLKVMRPEVYGNIGLGGETVGQRMTTMSPVSGMPPAPQVGGPPF
jgi:amino acid transporter